MDAIELRHLVERKRDDKELSEQDWRLVTAWSLDPSADQAPIAALLMACVLRGMTLDEVVGLTQAVIESGNEVKFTQFPFAVDKHSTGGVGDTGSLILVPMLAASGLHVAKLSGRSLGHTGGTLDKLESIPGFRTDLTAAEFEDGVAKIGCAIAAQTQDIVPADKALYALRDRTGTIPSPGLIAASVVSKKIAAGASVIGYDVKSGSGAFMRGEKQAIDLAKLLVELTHRFGRKAVAAVTNMEEPLCPMIGTGLEVIAARDFLRGKEHFPRLREVVLVVGELIAEAAGVSRARERLEAALQSGDAYEKFIAFIANQHGNLVALGEMHPIDAFFDIPAPRDGYLHAIATESLGNISRQIVGVWGPLSGLRMNVQVGDRVAKGQPLARVYCDKRDLQDDIAQCFVISNEQSPPSSVILDLIGT